MRRSICLFILAAVLWLMAATAHAEGNARREALARVYDQEVSGPLQTAMSRDFAAWWRGVEKAVLGSSRTPTVAQYRTLRNVLLQFRGRFSPTLPTRQVDALVRATTRTDAKSWQASSPNDDVSIPRGIRLPPYPGFRPWYRGLGSGSAEPSAARAYRSPRRGSPKVRTSKPKRPR